MKRLIALTFLLMASAFPVNAHSTLVSSNPSADSTVVDFPMEVTLTFNEELLKVGQENPNKVEVFDESGALVSGVSVLTGASIAAPVGINGNGAYTVKYRVVSKDGHVIEDSYDFQVQSPIAISAPIKEEAVSIPSSSPIPITSALVLALVIGLITLIKRRK